MEKTLWSNFLNTSSISDLKSLSAKRGTASLEFIKNTAKELRANAVALNLYPRGLLPDSYSGKLHPSYAPNARPILLVHGILHNHSAFHRLKKALIDAGMTNVFSVNYKSSRASIHKMTGELEKRVEQLLEITGAKQVDVIAHSLGGIIARNLMARSNSRAKVRKLICLGTPHQGSSRAKILKLWPGNSLGDDLSKGSYFLKELERAPLPKGSEIISISSEFDWTAKNSSDFHATGIPVSNFTNISYDHLGHTGLLYSAEVFDDIMQGLST